MRKYSTSMWMLVALLTVTVQPIFAEPNHCKSIIHHEAQTIDEKVKKAGLKCFAMPDCCTGAWKTNAACYVINKKTIREAWDEAKTDGNCLATESKRLKDIAIGHLSKEQIGKFMKCMAFPKEQEAGVCLGAVLECAPTASGGPAYGVCVGAFCGTSGASHSHRCAKDNGVIQ